jgi:hypothetical protein
MINQHPITLPLELVHQWADMLASRSDQAVFTKAAQWGADQELEACCAWLCEFHPGGTEQLRCSRRPQPPSLKEQALAALEDNDIDVYLIRRALESLPS